MKIRTFITCAISLFSVAAGYAKPIKTDDLSNLLIEGKNRLHVDAPEIQVAWAPDVYRGFSELLVDPALVGSLATPAINTPEVTFPSQMRSTKTARPWLRAIYDTPILTIATKGNQKAPVEWTFLVKDSQGKTFYEKHQKSVLPEKIEWNGLGNNGKPFSVGYDYTYSLSIVDQAGNPQRFSGKPFAIPACRFKQSGHVATHITPVMLFGDESSIKLSKEGMRVLLEVKDSLRDARDSFEVITYDNDSKFGLARSQAIKLYLTEMLEWDDKRIQAKSQVLDPKGYRHVEIIAK